MSPTHLVRALKKWWLALVALTLAGAAAGGAASLLMTPEYTSTAQVYVAYDAPAGAASGDLVQANNFALQKVFSYTQVVTSQRVLDTVIAELGLDDDAIELARDITVTVPPNSAVMDITAAAGNPQDAATLTQSIVDAFSDAVVELETPSTGGVPALRIESLENPVPAETPTTPNILVNLAIGMGAGFALGVVWIAIAATGDRKIYNSTDVEESTLRTLGSIPRTGRADSPTIVADQPLSEAAESYRTIAATLAHTPGVKLGTVVIASATPRDSSAALTGNLALALAEFGVKVAVVDANLRSGTLSSGLGLTGPGLGEVVTGAATLSQVLTRVNGITVLPAGSSTESPAELIGGGEFAAVLRAVAESHEVVLVESAPVLPLSDTLFAASVADSTVITMSSGAVTAAQLAAARSSLEGVGANLAGVVVLGSPRAGADADAATATYRDLRAANA